jgi:hypothetical protein
LDSNDIIGKGLSVEYKSFEEQNHLSDSNVFSLEHPESSEPKIWINKDLDEEVHSILDSIEQASNTAKVRDLMNDTVFLPTMMRLLLVSTNAVSSGEDETGYEWQRRIFDDFAEKQGLDDEEKSDFADALDTDVSRLLKHIESYVQREKQLKDDLERATNLR